MGFDDKDENGAPATRVVRVRGRVQGVGYRQACLRHARQAGITGWVRNRTDGSVEMMLQAAPRQLEAMCDWLRNGVAAARVDELTATEEPLPAARYERFEQLPTL